MKIILVAVCQIQTILFTYEIYFKVLRIQLGKIKKFLQKMFDHIEHTLGYTHIATLQN